MFWLCAVVDQLGGGGFGVRGDAGGLVGAGVLVVPVAEAFGLLFAAGGAAVEGLLAGPGGDGGFGPGQAGGPGSWRAAGALARGGVDEAGVSAEHVLVVPVR